MGNRNTQEKVSTPAGFQTIGTNWDTENVFQFILKSFFCTAGKNECLGKVKINPVEFDFWICVCADA